VYAHPVTSPVVAALPQCTIGGVVDATHVSAHTPVEHPLASAHRLFTFVCVHPVPLVPSSAHESSVQALSSEHFPAFGVYLQPLESPPAATHERSTHDGCVPPQCEAFAV
jgi:hypothetical protein